MKSSWSTYAVGRAVPSEGDFVSYPFGYAKDGTLPWVIFCHGAGGDADDVLEWYPELIDTLSERYVVGGFDFGGLYTWGNLDGSSLDSVLELMRDTFGAWSGPGVLLGGSMGGLTMSVFARERPDEVVGLVGVVAGWDLGSLHASNRGGMTASINAAYGGYDDVTDGPDHSPIQFAEELAGLPIQTWYASNDEIWPPADEAAFAAIVGSVERHNVGPLGHSLAAVQAVENAAVVAFIDSLF